MTLQNFVFRMRYKSAQKPDHVSLLRWQGMLAWWGKHHTEFLSW